MISDLSEYRKNGLRPKFIETVCKEVKIKEAIQTPNIKHYKTSGKARPCINTALHTKLETKIGHKLRLAIACEYLAKGKGIKETAFLFKDQPDYGNGQRSLYFVKDTKNKGYKPFKCSTINQLGFCLKEKCRIWRRKNREGRKGR